MSITVLDAPIKVAFKLFYQDPHEKSVESYCLRMTLPKSLTVLRVEGRSKR